ncbi:hypothetical protein BJ138DRAFT_1177332, partial [Hygrophoropsis aurantiaca]
MDHGNLASEERQNESSNVPPPLQDLLLVIFIHGFKGTESSFGSFPSRLEHILTETIDNVHVKCAVFPAYETKGKLVCDVHHYCGLRVMSSWLTVEQQDEAVERFADWLTTLTVEKEVANGQGGGAGKANIVLCGHSMGGLLAADALLSFVHSRPDKNAPLWPKIIACIAFDTPFLGLHPVVFKNSATKAIEYATTARTAVSDVFSIFSQDKSPPSVSPKPPMPSITAGSTSAAGSVWSKWVPAAYAIGGAVVAGAAAGTAYYKRDDIGIGYNWATDHMKYVQNLWDKDALNRRLEDLINAEKQHGVLVRVFYTFLPPSPPAYSTSRTFSILPSRTSSAATHFIASRNTLAIDEIQAHISMFDPKSNDGYYELGLQTAKAIRETIHNQRGSAPATGSDATINADVTTR